MGRRRPLRARRRRPDARIATATLVVAVRGRLGDRAEEGVADPLGLGPARRAACGAVDPVVGAVRVVERLRIDVPAVDEHGRRAQDPMLLGIVVVLDFDDLDLGGNPRLVQNALDDDQRHLAIRTVLAREDLDPHRSVLDRHVSAPSPGERCPTFPALTLCTHSGDAIPRTREARTILYDLCSIRPMIVGHMPDVEVGAGTALADLVGLSAASRAPRDELPTALADALEDVGDTEGESWLNLLGVAIDAGPPYGTAQLLDVLRALDGIELRRHLLGRFAWSWCTLAGTDDIDAAAGGDRAAARRLLEHPRYYGGHAPTSLKKLLPLDGDETRARLV